MNIKILVPSLDEYSLKECLSSDAFIVPFNPYANLYPSRTTFRSDDLDMSKIVNNLGLHVYLPTIKGSVKKELVFQKHFVIDNTLLLFIVNIELNILTGIITGILANLATKDKKPKLLIINLSKQGDVVACYNEKQEIVPDDEAKATILEMATPQAYTQPNPILSRPTPIHLEHSSKVIGWAQASFDDKGLKISNCKIDDDEVLKLIREKKLVGFSIGGIVKRYECNICHKNYFLCPHIKKETYNGKLAVGDFRSLDLVEISIVSDPANVDALIQEYE